MVEGKEDDVLKNGSVVKYRFRAVNLSLCSIFRSGWRTNSSWSLIRVRQWLLIYLPASPGCRAMNYGRLRGNSSAPTFPRHWNGMFEILSFIPSFSIEYFGSFYQSREEIRTSDPF